MLVFRGLESTCVTPMFHSGRTLSVDWMDGTCITTTLKKSAPDACVISSNLHITDFSKHSLVIDDLDPIIEVLPFCWKSRYLPFRSCNRVSSHDRCGLLPTGSSNCTYNRMSSSAKRIPQGTLKQGYSTRIFILTDATVNDSPGGFLQTPSSTSAMRIPDDPRWFPRVRQRRADTYACADGTLCVYLCLHLYIQLCK